MAYKLSAPIIEDFILVDSDKIFNNEGDPTRIAVRQASQGEQERRARVFAEISRVIDNENIFGATSLTLRQTWSMEELKRVEVYLTLAACNIQDEDGSPLFTFKNDRLAMDESAFRDAWYLLPPMIAEEIHSKVLEVNYVWTGRGE